MGSKVVFHLDTSTGDAAPSLPHSWRLARGGNPLTRDRSKVDCKVCVKWMQSHPETDDEHKANQ